MKKLIVGNWKAHPASQQEALALFDAISRGITRNLTRNNAEVVVCPPFVYISNFEFRASDFIKLGAQNITEEFPPETLKNMGVQYVILGHSDVRKAGETDAVIHEKIKKCLATGLKVILCVGEHEGENKLEVLQKQLTGISDFEFRASDLAIAYEPIWAIGTGNNCSIEETQATILLIKKIVGSEIKVLYGGSVKAQNFADYLKNPSTSSGQDGGVDGLLVGGASLDPEEFVKIVKAVD